MDNDAFIAMIHNNPGWTTTQALRRMRLRGFF